MPLSLATWNINSIRMRQNLVLDFLSQEKPDVLALQEIKCTNDQFPKEVFNKAGYTYQAINGQKAYHGVALLSKIPLEKVERRQFFNIDHARHICANVDYGRGAINIHNFYIPAGGDEPDPIINPKFAHKLGFYDEMLNWFKESQFKNKQIIAGDFNIAPHENDVWNHKQLLKVVSHTQQEIDLLNNLLEQGNWTDLVRQHIPTTQKLYSWWSYRAKDWNASDKGRRLDHIWSTPDMAELSSNARVLRQVRGWSEKPSDHAPIIVDFD